MTRYTPLDQNGALSNDSPPDGNQRAGGPARDCACIAQGLRNSHAPTANVAEDAHEAHSGEADKR